jgi:hypothetical protein
MVALAAFVIWKLAMTRASLEIAHGDSVLVVEVVREIMESRLSNAMWLRKLVSGITEGQVESQTRKLHFLPAHLIVL